MDAPEQIAARFPVIMQIAYRLPVTSRTKIMRIHGRLVVAYLLIRTESTTTLLSDTRNSLNDALEISGH